MTTSFVNRARLHGVQSRGRRRRCTRAYRGRHRHASPPFKSGSTLGRIGTGYSRARRIRERSVRHGGRSVMATSRHAANRSIVRDMITLHARKPLTFNRELLLRWRRDVPRCQRVNTIAARSSCNCVVGPRSIVRWGAVLGRRRRGRIRGIAANGLHARTNERHRIAYHQHRRHGADRARG